MLQTNLTKFDYRIFDIYVLTVTLWRLQMNSTRDSLSDRNNNLFDITKLLSSTEVSSSNRTNNVADLTKALIPEQYQIILLSLAYGIISLLALIGNSSIIYIVIYNRRMHSVTNYFICNLALADCLVACFAIPFQVNIYYFLNKIHRSIL